MIRAVAVGTILMALGFTAVIAQDADIRFEVASVRLSAPAERGQRRGGPPTVSPDRVVYQRTLFRKLLMDAYGVQLGQIKGPAWTTADAISGGPIFDVSANLPPGATREQIPTMLQNLLKDRFKLSVHREEAPSLAFAIVVVKPGSKLKTSAGPRQESEYAELGPRGAVKYDVGKDGFPNLFPKLGMGATFDGSTVRMRFRDYPLVELVRQFSFMLNVPIIDSTGLTGHYDFTLEFTLPENTNAVAVRAMLPLSPDQQVPRKTAVPTDGELAAASAVSSAMEKQLGLKLQATRLPRDLLVIDHVEKTPTDN
jgi:uncharacterized protein (TIGR03435 family)